MKKLLACCLLSCLLITFFSACREQEPAEVITYDTNTTAPTSEPAETQEPTSEPQEDTQTAPTTLKHFEMAYASAQTQRDAVGNIWLNVIVAYQNVGNETIRLDYGDIRVYSDGEEGIVLEDVPCYPNVLEPGQMGYYFEQRQVDMDENKRLYVEMLPDSTTSEPLTHYTVEDVQIRDSAYGIEIEGMYEATAASGLVCVAVVLYNLESDPFFVLFDYISAGNNSFVLSADKLPEGLKSTDISSYVAYAYGYEG